ncbi:hypothetical protein [Marinobacterium sedimentorum]|uniref:hypothetical protein n=1 Tax=Marinobacterium sedimentorum TaxID=2927804 RepID=UPI0020C5C236|nr:hypothetical protein [Marinobacterium sedimentorum]MCP8688673.1 hypothetical protein [Marinobacterium sedimentorum]
MQSALSSAPVISSAEHGRFNYVALRSNGILLAGSELSSQNSYSAAGYIPSFGARGVQELSSLKASRLKSLLGRYRSESIILSNEGWGNRHDIFVDTRLLERLGLDCHIVIYIRPQVGWYNSAWWQWGAWTGKPLEEWVSANLDKTRWAKVVRAWEQVPGVNRVTVRVLPSDILPDFYALLGTDSPKLDKINLSLPGSVLRIFQRHQGLRKNAHDSAIDFSIGRHLKIGRSPTPWVIPQGIVKSIIDSNLNGNQELIHLLDPDQRLLFERDAAWWDADSYSDKMLEEAGMIAPVVGDSDRLAAAALEGLADLDHKYRALVKELELAKRSQFGGSSIKKLLSRFR